MGHYGVGGAFVCEALVDTSVHTFYGHGRTPGSGGYTHHQQSSEKSVRADTRPMGRGCGALTVATEKGPWLVPAPHWVRLS
eukprot:6940463-Prymnesium_polylepis.1